MFEACLKLPKTPEEADLIADNLDALAKALREWPVEAWRKVDAPKPDAGLFERLVARTAPSALEARTRTHAMHSAQAVAQVLRVMWPDARPALQREASLAVG